jgi:hypothetical protein
MIKFTIAILFAFLYLSACTENPINQRSDSADSVNSAQLDTIAVHVSENINFEDLVKYYTADSLFSFVAPRGFFMATNNGLQARDQDFEMETQTFTQFYPCDPDEEILTIKSLQEKFMQGIKVTYKTSKSGFFVVSGLDQQNKIVYIKGDYSELHSMQGRDEGEPAHMWSKAGVIRFSYPQVKKTDFNRVVKIITNSLQVNHDMM